MRFTAIQKKLEKWRLHNSRSGLLILFSFSSPASIISKQIIIRHEIADSRFAHFSEPYHGRVFGYVIWITAILPKLIERHKKTI